MTPGFFQCRNLISGERGRSCSRSRSAAFFEADMCAIGRRALGGVRWTEQECVARRPRDGSKQQRAHDGVRFAVDGCPVSFHNLRGAPLHQQLGVIMDLVAHRQCSTQLRWCSSRCAVSRSIDHGGDTGRATLALFNPAGPARGRGVRRQRGAGAPSWLGGCHPAVRGVGGSAGASELR